MVRISQVDPALSIVHARTSRRQGSITLADCHVKARLPVIGASLPEQLRLQFPDALLGQPFRFPQTLRIYENNMNDILKATCLAVYLLAIVAAAGALPDGLASVVQWIAVLLVAGHVIELVVAFKAIRRHQGPLIDSIGLTLLFGFLHWQPLRKRP